MPRDRSRSRSLTPPLGRTYRTPTTLAAIDGDLERIYNLLSSRKSRGTKVRFAMSEIHWHLRHPGRGDANNSSAGYLRIEIDQILPLLLRESETAKSHRARSERGLVPRLEARNNEQISILVVRVARQLAVWRDPDPGAEVRREFHACPECRASYGGPESLRIHRVLDHGLQVPSIKRTPQ